MKNNKIISKKGMNVYKSDAQFWVTTVRYATVPARVEPSLLRQ